MQAQALFAAGQLFPLLRQAGDLLIQLKAACGELFVDLLALLLDLCPPRLQLTDVLCVRPCLFDQRLLPGRQLFGTAAELLLKRFARLLRFGQGRLALLQRRAIRGQPLLHFLKLVGPSLQLARFLSVACCRVANFLGSQF